MRAIGRSAVPTFFLLSLALATPAVGGGGAHDPDRLADPETLARHWEHSVEAYRHLTGIEPENGLGWFRLGTALHHSGDYGGAVVAFERAERLGFTPVEARYHLAVNHALLGHHEEARLWLRRARAIDLTRDGDDAIDEVLSRLGRDPRIERLLRESPQTSRLAPSGPQPHTR